jgi:O-antigen ligase
LPVAHDTFLGVASELGFVGLIIYLAILIFAYKEALALATRNSTLGVGLLVGLTTFIIMSLTLSWEVVKIQYVLYGSVLALSIAGSDAEYPERTRKREPRL